MGRAGFGFGIPAPRRRNRVASGGADTTAPTITSSASPSVVENAQLAHVLTANEPVTWAIRTAVQNVASVDHAKFELSGAILRWLGDGTKDFEEPDDADTNNTYVVVVRATDGATNTADQTITVTVTNAASGDGLSIVSAPTLSGDPVVGQRLFTTNGTYSETPDSYTYQWEKDNVAVDGETNDNYLVKDADVGSVFRCKVTAHKASYTSSAANPSANTSAVTDISLTNAITALTRTSASGVTPMTFRADLGSNVYAGYILWARVYSDAGLSTKTQDVSHTLTIADMAGTTDISAQLTAAGMTAIGATDWLQLAIVTVSPAGTPYSYTYGTAISPTDATLEMTWSTTDKAAGYTLSNGNLTATHGSGQGNIRGSRGLTSGKWYWEVVPTAQIQIGVANSDAPLTPAWTRTAYGGIDTDDASVMEGNGFLFYNGGETNTGVTFNNGDTVQCALDMDASPPKFWIGVEDVWANGDPSAGTGGVSMTAIGGTVFPGMCSGGGHGATANFGAAAFAYTKPTGFTGPSE